MEEIFTRKWLLKTRTLSENISIPVLPIDIENHSKEKFLVEQAYFVSNQVVRLCKETNLGNTKVKLWKAVSETSCVESAKFMDKILLSEAEFKLEKDSLTEVINFTLSKHRYIYHYLGVNDKRYATIDVFCQKLTDVAIIKFQFTSKEEASDFELPSFLEPYVKKEIFGEKKYKYSSYYLARLN